MTGAPAVFIHGVPDTPLVWEPLVGNLVEREVVTLALPGFGCDTPQGFGSTRWEYVDWLAAELEAIGEPVDLVGHDQGSVISQGLVVTRAELVRSFVLSGGVCDPDFLWHTVARVWQTASLGEQSRDAWLSLSAEERVEQLLATGMPSRVAERAASAMDRRMLDSILPLYRSEPYFGDWAFDAGASYPPGLVAWGCRDPFQASEFGRKAAEAAGAGFVELDCGHWWQVEQPEAAARLLEEFWDSVVQASASEVQT